MMTTDDSTGRGDSAPPPLDYQALLDHELASAPAQFVQVYDSLANGDLPRACQLATTAANSLAAEHPHWAAAALCARAWCHTMSKRYGEAVEDATAAAALGLNHLAGTYYHLVLPASLDQLDQLQPALVAARSASEYFDRLGAVAQAAQSLLLKASILKQLAAPLSRNPDSWLEARQYIIEAIESLRDALIREPQLIDGLRDELSATGRIAGRAGLETVDFASNLPAAIAEVLSRHFSESSLAEEAFTQRSNLALDAAKGGDRDRAATLYELALTPRLSHTPHPSHRAFKAIVAYQAGVNLLRKYGLEGMDAAGLATPHVEQQAEHVLSVWRLASELHDSLTRQEISALDGNLRRALTDAIWAIARDPLKKLEQ